MMNESPEIAIFDKVGMDNFMKEDSMVEAVAQIFSRTGVRLTSLVFSLSNDAYLSLAKTRQLLAFFCLPEARGHLITFPPRLTRLQLDGMVFSSVEAAWLIRFLCSRGSRLEILDLPLGFQRFQYFTECSRLSDGSPPLPLAVVQNVLNAVPQLRRFRCKFFRLAPNDNAFNGMRWFYPQNLTSLDLTVEIYDHYILLTALEDLRLRRLWVHFSPYGSHQREKFDALLQFWGGKGGQSKLISSLAEFHMKNFSGSDAGLHHLLSFSRLESLSLLNCCGITGPLLDSLTLELDLRALNLSWSALDDACIDAIRRNGVQLHTLGIVHCRFDRSSEKVTRALQRLQDESNVMRTCCDGNLISLLNQKIGFQCRWTEEAPCTANDDFDFP